MRGAALFLAGPLAEPGVFAAVTGHAEGGAPARLPDHALMGRGEAPVAVPRGGGMIEGRLVSMPEGAARDRLDSYAATLALVAREVEVLHGADRLRAVLLEGAEPPAGAQGWNAGAWRARHGASWPLIAAEIAEHAPPLSPGSFARQRTTRLSTKESGSSKIPWSLPSIFCTCEGTCLPVKCFPITTAK